MSDVSLSGGLADGLRPGSPSNKPRLDHETSPLPRLYSWRCSRAACSTRPIVSIRTSKRPARRSRRGCLSARRGAADRARLRVRQRLPRYCQRRRDRDLHALDAGATSPCSGRASSISSACCCRRGAVAFGIISLLPVELILQVGSGAGFAMVFALLIAAIIWNLGTWWLGLPSSVVAHPDRLDHRRRRRQLS